jgi:hypothetical protein
MERSGLETSLEANLGFTYRASPDYTGKKNK